MNNENQSDINPVEPFLRMDRMPHIWCAGCGIGTTVNCFTRALIKSTIPLEKVCVVSGIGCTGRVAGYMNLDSFHTTHGRAIPFATGLKLANPSLSVVVYSGDGDLFAIGGNHFIHAARRNINIKVICINNFLYAMTGGQVAPTTPITSIVTTAPFGCYEKSFNLPYLAESCGAVYVARWTSYHVRQIEKSMTEVLKKKGFTFIEILSPCPTLYGRRNRLGSGLDTMKYNADTKELDLEFGGKITVGKFVDIENQTYIERMNENLSKVIGPKYEKISEE